MSVRGGNDEWHVAGFKFWVACGGGGGWVGWGGWVGSGACFIVSVEGFGGVTENAACYFMKASGCSHPEGWGWAVGLEGGQCYRIECAHPCPPAAICSPHFPLQPAPHLLQSYAIPNLRLDVKTCRANLPPATFMRAPGELRCQTVHNNSAFTD